MRRTQMILLGAGASIPAGVPGAVAMVDMLLERLTYRGFEAGTEWDYRISRCAPAAAKVLPSIVSILREWGSQQSPPTTIDIEAVYNGIQALCKIPTSYLGAFFHASMGSQYPLEDLKDASLFLRESVVQLATIKSSDAVAYLRPLLAPVVKRQARLVIATLNYDNSIELAAERESIDLRNDADLPPTLKTPCVLLKLHGSVDWVHYEWKGREEIPVLPIFPTVIRRDRFWGGKPAIIFGQENKLEPISPFPELYQAFNKELQRTIQLTVIGYSFRDRHINMSILEWLARRKGTVLRVIDPTAGNEEWFWRAVRTAGVPCSSRTYEFLTEDSRIVTLGKMSQDIVEADLW